MLPDSKTKVIGFAAWSGTGKTTLLTQLIPILRDQGLRIGMIKHAHHQFDIDKPGKDSYELRKAGAGQMLVTSANRWALMVEKDNPSEPELGDMIARLDTENLDLILVEGFRHENFPKIELHRPSLKKPLIYPDDKHVIAIATDEPLATDVPVPTLDINSPQAIATFIRNEFSI